MFIATSFPLAVLLCVVTMLCWGSWGNTQKLSGKGWSFQLFYWDYALGVMLLALVSALTLGSLGTAGRPFLVDLRQASGSALGSALFGGVIFNLSNILLVAAMEIAGMAVAFPVGVGLALVIGVTTSYLAQPAGSPLLIGAGVGAVVAAILLDAIAYRRLASATERAPKQGFLLSIGAGLLMGCFYRFVVASMASDFAAPAAGKMGPYSALVVFSIGLFTSNFVWNSLAMRWPIAGSRVGFRDYFKGSLRQHGVGLLGGIIWNTGMSFSIIASGAAGPAVSYGLGQGATMVAAVWGVFVWKEFRAAPKGTNLVLGWMFVCYLVGLALLVLAR